MCGLAGWYTRADHSADMLERTARAMADALRHRGPDDSGVHIEREHGLAFGFRRLSIIDLSPAGHQPMLSASGRYVVMLNGEVYNFPSLRMRLEGGGVEFNGDSDTEVVANSFDRWGVREALQKFVGMFAIAAWDRKRQRLYLARDRMGIKPLYLYRKPGCVAFASELKALHCLPDFDHELDRAAIAAFLRHQAVPAPLSIFRHVSKLLPGQLVEFESPDAEPRTEAYWSLEEVAREALADPLRNSEALDGLEDVLEEAVRLRLRADVPLGALLSGGIDSTVVVAMAQEASSSPIRTFTIAFDREEHDESAHAAAVANHLGTDHTELRLTGQAARDVIPELANIFDEPLADPSQIPTYCVSRMARQEVTVALSGDGGDELFAGYNRYIFGERAIRKALAVPRLVRRAAAAVAGGLTPHQWTRLHGGAGELLPGLLRHRLPGQKIRKLGSMAEQDSARSMYHALFSAFQEPSRFVKGGAEPRMEDFEEVLAILGSDRLLDGMQYVDQKAYLPDVLLTKLDRASMSVGLEVRVPLLDHRVVQLAWRLPADQRTRGETGKLPLRELAYRRVPRHLLDRPKVGFSVPLEEWLAGPLRGWAGDLLTSSRLGGDDVLESSAVSDAWDRFDQGETDLGSGVWALLMFKAWQERWL